MRLLIKLSYQFWVLIPILIQTLRLVLIPIQKSAYVKELVNTKDRTLPEVARWLIARSTEAHRLKLSQTFSIPNPVLRYTFILDERVF